MPRLTRREFAGLVAGLAVPVGAWAARRESAMRQYVERIRSDVRAVRKQELGSIEAAGAGLAERVAAGGRLLIFDRRGNYSAEAIGRAGGLMAIAGLRRGDEAPKGDGLIVVSNETAAEEDVAVAGAARERGTLVVAICPVRTTEGSLAEASEWALDNYVSDEDACVTIPGMAAPIAPTSGALNAAVLWALTAAYIEAMEARGRPPEVWMSIKRPEAKEHNEKAMAASREARPAEEPVGARDRHLAGAYLKALERNIDTVVRKEWAHLERAAEVVAQAIGEGRAAYQSAAGHMIVEETEPGRRGRPDLFSVLDPKDVDRLRPGDVLVVSNQYGVLAEYVEMALDAKARGATLISMSPRSNPERIVRSHPSGTAVYDHADILIDTHIPYGDAALAAPQGSPGSCPTSGTIQSMLYWALTCGVAEGLA